MSMNKKEEVLKELGQLAELLNIKLDYVIEANREYLVCNDTKICTNATSIYGIREEFFGYVFLNEWRNRPLGDHDSYTRKYIMKYWYDDNFKQPFYKGF